MTVAAEPDAGPGPLLRAALAFQRFVDRLNEIAGGLSRWFVLATIVVGLFNTILRYVGKVTHHQLTSNSFVDLTWNLYALIFIFGFGYVLKHGVNVRVDFWYANQPRRRKLRIDLVGHLISLMPFTIMGMWISFGAARTSWDLKERSANAGGFPIYPIKAMILLGLVLLFLQALAEVIKLVAELRGIAAGHEEPEAPIRVE